MITRDKRLEYGDMKTEASGLNSIFYIRYSKLYGN